MIILLWYYGGIVLWLVCDE